MPPSIHTTSQFFDAIFTRGRDEFGHALGVKGTAQVDGITPEDEEDKTLFRPKCNWFGRWDFSERKREEKHCYLWHNRQAGRLVFNSTKCLEWHGKTATLQPQHLRMNDENSESVALEDDWISRYGPLYWKTNLLPPCICCNHLGGASSEDWGLGVQVVGCWRSVLKEQVAPWRRNL